MQNKVQCTQYRLNPNIRVKKLRSGQKYLLVSNNGEKYYPIFLKQDMIDYIINLLSDYKEDGKINKDELTRILYNQNILVDSDNENERVKYKNIDDIFKLNKLALATRTPQYAKFELTFNCNYSCKYCYVNGSNSKFLRYNEITKILDELNTSGINTLYLTGGEPFVHPDILDIIKYCTTLDFNLSIQTNGYFITDEIAKVLSAYRNISISISFHSIDEAKFDNFTNTAGSYKKTINAISILKKYNIDLICKCCVTTENEHEIKDIIDYFKENNIKFEIFTQILPNIKDELNTKEYCVSSETINWLYDNKYLEFSKSTCSAFRDKFWVAPMGEVYPCELYRYQIGNLFDNSFEKIWENNEVMNLVNDKLYIEDEKCKECQYKKWCNKCLAYKYYDNWSKYLEQFCRKARVVKNMYN